MSFQSTYGYITGNGGTITFASGFFARVIRFTPPAEERDEFDNTTLDMSVERTEPADIHRYMSLEVEMVHNVLATVPIDQAPETLTITWSDGTTDSGNGFMTAYRPGEAVNNNSVKATATIKIQHTWTKTPSSSGL